MTRERYLGVILFMYKITVFKNNSEKKEYHFQISLSELMVPFNLAVDSGILKVLNRSQVCPNEVKYTKLCYKIC